MGQDGIKAYFNVLVTMQSLFILGALFRREPGQYVGRHLTNDSAMLV
jgi:hypothetical protein